MIRTDWIAAKIRNKDCNDSFHSLHTYRSLKLHFTIVLNGKRWLHRCNRCLAKRLLLRRYNLHTKCKLTKYLLKSFFSFVKTKWVEIVSEIGQEYTRVFWEWAKLKTLRIRVEKSWYRNRINSASASPDETTRSVYALLRIFFPS